MNIIGHLEEGAGDCYDENDVAIYVHACNAYCHDDLHAAVVWTLRENFSVEQLIAAQKEFGEQIDVLEMRVALEAPEYGPGGEGPYPYRFLVTFRWASDI